MNKQEFVAQLRKGLLGLPKEEVEGRLTFYEEMIDDRMEEGLSEEEAVLAVGTADKIVSQIVADIPFGKIARGRIKPKRRLKAWEIILLALGSPIWLSLSVAVFAVILSFYISLWAVIISLWAVFGSLIGCALGGVAAGVGFTLGDHLLSGIAMIGAGIVCAGLSIFMFYGCKAATKSLLILTKKLVIWTKNRFIKKEEA